jgi:hypothetical protein
MSEPRFSDKVERTQKAGEGRIVTLLHEPHVLGLFFGRDESDAHLGLGCYRGHVFSNNVNGS